MPRRPSEPELFRSGEPLEAKGLLGWRGGEGEGGRKGKLTRVRGSASSRRTSARGGAGGRSCAVCVDGEEGGGIIRI